MPFDVEPREQPQGCRHCIDPDGFPCFPHYGHAPWMEPVYQVDGVACFTHVDTGSREFDPDFFEPCTEDEGRGTYFRCPECLTDWRDDG